ncbi:MAG: MarR family transcriptional regulator, partial [Bacteroidia bacterium]|nr:MarR family transcriptional regulator [Bacteroidia bacterium]
MEKLESVFFYHLEKAIKSYRQFAQNKLNSNALTITIDQWLVLKVLSDNQDITQTELAERVFKDKASVTRII